MESADRVIIAGARVAERTPSAEPAAQSDKFHQKCNCGKPAGLARAAFEALTGGGWWAAQIEQLTAVTS